MKCPCCGSDKTVVYEGPDHYDIGVSVRRQRICKGCGRKFYTREFYSNKTIEEVMRYVGTNEHI